VARAARQPGGQGGRAAGAGGPRPGAAAGLAPGRPRGARPAAGRRGHRHRVPAPPRPLPGRAGGSPVKLAGVELRRVALPLVTPFRTSFGVERHRDVLLVRAVTDDGEGWGECVAAAEPRYSSEYADGAADVLRRFLVPAVAVAGDLDPEAVGVATAFVKGHRRAEAPLELAMLGPWLRPRAQPLAGYLGATRDRVPAGVSVGIMDSLAELLDAVAGYLAPGCLRLRLKIDPGWAREPVAAARERFGDDLLLQVDANAAYTLADADHLRGLDRFG